MRMLKPSPGEAADRQTILQLKLDHADTQAPTDEFELATTETDMKPVVHEGRFIGAVGKTVNRGSSKIDLQPFVQEHEMLQQYLEKDWFPDHPLVGDSYDLLFDQLKEVNSKLWNLEDEARALKQATKGQATVYRASVVLFEITDLNDQRADLVKQINALFDVQHQEKIYAAS